MNNIKRMVEEKIEELDTHITCIMGTGSTEYFIKLLDVYVELVKVYKSLD